MQVKARVENDLFPCDLSIVLEQTIVEWIVALQDLLWTCCPIVRMNSCGEDRDFLRNAVKRKNHIGSRNILRLKDIVTYTVNGCRRRERHPEVALLNHVVNNLDNLRIGPIRENRPVPQSSGTKLHPATTAGNNMPTSKQFSNPQLDVLWGFYAYLMRK